jgi:hypothetical protein
MAEIKSTLDLIMEKTKNLSITAAEKEDFHRKELMKKIRGVLQNYLNQAINLDTLKELLTKGEPDSLHSLKEVVKEEILDRLQPDDNHQRLYTLMDKILGVNHKITDKIITAFQAEVSAKKEEKNESLKSELAKAGISGPAVIANVAVDETFRAAYEAALLSCRKRLAEKIK